jgi:hypothetical protein
MKNYSILSLFAIITVITCSEFSNEQGDYSSREQIDYYTDYNGQTPLLIGQNIGD